MIRVNSYRRPGVCPAAGLVTEWTGSPMMVEKPKKPGRVSRAVDVVAEWLFPDPTAHLDRAWKTYRDQQEQAGGKKTQKKG